jgi:tight adherence protein B
LANFLNSPLFIIAVVSGLGVILVGIGFFLVPTDAKSRLNQYVDNVTGIETVQVGERHDPFQGFRQRLNSAFSFLSSDELRIRINSAHWQISDLEYILLRGLGTVLGFGLGWWISKSVIGGIGLAVLAYVLPGILLVRSAEVRRQKFANQLLDALILIKGAVQSGYSLLQSLDLVKREMAAPASEEFERVIREVQLGLPINQALLNLSTRMQNDDLYLVVTSIIINLQVGGNLTTMLTSVTETIRARIYLFSEIRALTSYARYAGLLLTLLPFITGLAIFFLNPTYFDKVPQSIISQLMLCGAVVLLIMGNIWMRLIIKIKV